MTTVLRKASLLFAGVCAAALSARAEVAFDVDFTRSAGPVRKLNGQCIGPMLSKSEFRLSDAEYKAMLPASIRNHDDALVNYGKNVVDIEKIFPIWNPKTDAKDPDNYFFLATDDLLEEQYKVLPEDGYIVYRLGSSIEHGKRVYFAKPPKNQEQYAEVCAGIVRHYTRGWADGRRYKRIVWEIGGEANLPGPLWDAPYETYMPFYAAIAKRIKSEFPEAKVGGPALWQNHTREKLFVDAEKFVKYCRSQNAAIDFFSWHSYMGDWRKTDGDARAFRRLLDDNGYAKAEMHLNEWHYTNEWLFGSRARKKGWLDVPQGPHGIDSAAFTAFCLIHWQDTPIDMSNFYTANSQSSFGMCDDDGVRRPTYHAFRLFAGLLTPGGAARHPVTGEISPKDCDSAAVLAATGKDGVKRLYASVFKPSIPTVLKIRLAGALASGKASVTTLTGATPAGGTKTVDYANGELVLPPAAESSTWLVELR